MKKKEGWCFEKLVILAIAIALVVSFVTITAYTTGEQRAGITPFVTDGTVHSWPSPVSKAVVWDNGMNYIGLGASQNDPASGLDPIEADDFMFEVDQLVGDVHWIGGYWVQGQPPYDGNFDWEIKFYNDFGDGTKPGAVIATYLFPNAQVNETLIESTFSYFCSYSVDLPATLSFMAGMKYWISIQGIGAYPPQSGWGMHDDPILLHQAVFKSVYFGFPNWTNTSDVFGYPVDMCFQLTYEEEEECDWQPGDPHKMHFPQLPDEDGWDVNATQPVVLADDWQCSDSGWVKDIHFWGSWKHGNEGTIIGFWLSIHSNIPGPPYSMPGETLWELYVENFNFTPVDPPTMEGWYDPSTGEVIPNDHQAYFQYNICLDEPDWFWQEQDVIYWLNISAVVLEYPDAVWGWKSSEDHFMDDAVWAYWGELDWVEIYEPGTSPGPIMNQFYIEFDMMGMPIYAGGTDYYDDGTSFYGWYYYYMTGWWNIWFYNAPFDYDRWKEVYIEYWWIPTDPYEYWIEFALNYATDVWSLEGVPGRPPLPDDQPEEMFIYREWIPIGPPETYLDWWYTIPMYNPEWVSIDVMGMNVWIEGFITHECLPTMDTVSLDLAFVITGGPPCEPSIDVEKKVWDKTLGEYVDSTDIDSCTNADFQITIHNDGTCCDLTEIVVSDFMDASLEFLDAEPPPDVVTPVPGGTLIEWYFPGPLEPCNTIDITVVAHVIGPPCHLDSNYVWVQGECEEQAVGVYDEDVAYVHATEPPCEPSIDVEKKVWDEANQDWVDFADIDSCTNADFKITVHNDGTCCDLTDIFVHDYMDSSLDFMSAEPPPIDIVPYPGGVFLEWHFPGPLPVCNTIDITITAHVVGPVCHVDTNVVDVSGYCEATDEYVYDYDTAYVHPTAPEWPNHKMHYPQLPDPFGWDVIATMGYMPESPHPGIVVADDFMCTRTRAITDIHFWGSWLWDQEVEIRGFYLSIHSNIPSPPAPWSMPDEELWSTYITDFEVVLEGEGEQGWYDPFAGVWEPWNHSMYYRYDITFIEKPFYQDSGTIYWLNIMADIGPIGYMGFPEPPLWGWKTSLNHWMDDAVWSVWMPPVYEWIPLYDPMTGETLDMAFVITGPEVLCGDVNNDGIIELGDIVYLINFVFRAGPAPVPMMCVGDVNNDNAVELGDIVYLINFVFRAGPPPDPYCCTPPWKAE